MKSGSRILGIGLILIGLLSILVSFNVIDIEFWEVWPFILLVLGLMFEIGFFTGSKKDPGLLVPGGILITISMIFIINIVFGWYMMSYIWPMFILAPGLGLLQLYLFSPKSNRAGILIPTTILLLLGTYFLLGNFYYFVNFSLFISIVIIIVGLMLIFKRNTEDHNSQS